MFRRVVGASSSRAVMASASTSTNTAVVASTRQITTTSLIISSLSCYLCMLCWGSWFNNYANVKRYGRWRFRNQIDDNIIVTDFKAHRYAGCLFGLFFYSTMVGSRRYRTKNSSLEQHPGWVRYGPL